MHIAVIGHSHIQCLLQAYGDYHNHKVATFRWLQLHQFKISHKPGARNLSIENIDKALVTEEVQKVTSAVDAVILMITGNAPTIFGLKRWGGLSESSTVELTSATKEQINLYLQAHDEWIGFLHSIITVPIYVISPPPPVGDNSWILDHPGRFSEILARSGVSNPAYRLAVYQYWVSHLRATAEKYALDYLDLPSELLIDGNFLHCNCYGDEPSHAGVFYGSQLLEHLATALPRHNRFIQSEYREASAREINLPPKKGKSSHPYSDLPNSSFWKQAVAMVPCESFDPVTGVPFRISPTDKVATAGSCFAQHISKRIRTAGFHFLVTEQSACPEASGVPTIASHDFSARYGNIYTARQLLQLFDRSFGYFTPLEDHWILPNGHVCDPFRPRIGMDGFPSVKELREDRRQHLEAVKDMFLQLDVMIFTLGLTESWLSRLDGACYPLAPGVVGGEFDPEKYYFANFSVDEVFTDLFLFLKKLRMVNRGARLILTVSPVPLVATNEQKNVLVATTYSKSVLRVAAEMLTRTSQNTYYFPSYEIITGNFNRGSYFASDLRSVTDKGVDHVMSVFMKNLTTSSSYNNNNNSFSKEQLDSDSFEEMIKLAEVVCEEELLERK